MTGPLKNSRHERFAQELAKGKSQSEAYVEAAYRPDTGAASRLSANVSVQSRVAEIKGKVAERCVVTVASLTDRLLKIAAKGEGKEDAPMLSVARASLMDVAKLNGFIVDKRLNVDFTKLSDEEIEVVVALLAKAS